MSKQIILDFGAGWKALHTARLRAAGLDCVAWDFGRNFDPRMHYGQALRRTYDLVLASNVLNVQGTSHALGGCVAELAQATGAGGQMVANYPAAPRKLGLSPGQVERVLQSYFCEVDRLSCFSCPVFVCRGAIRSAAGETLRGFSYTQAEMDVATIRPAGAVGLDPVVYRMALALTHREGVAL